MKTIRYGIEIETIGQTRLKVAEAIQSVVGGTVRYVGAPRCYDPYEVTAPDGRIWRVMADASLAAPFELQAEVVSPILTYEDLPTLQEVVRAVRRSGARVDQTCGLHLHLDGAAFTPRAIRNLTKMVHKNEELIELALQVHQERRARWCRRVNPEFLEAIETRRPESFEALNRAWYGRYNPAPAHYDPTRYAALNLHALWQKGTVEFRSFNSTLHAGKVKAYVQFVLALGARAIAAKSASSKKRPLNPATAKYDFRVVLLKLGMVGDEFKTARLHLLSHLGGSAAWPGERRDGAPERAAA